VYFNFIKTKNEALARYFEGFYIFQKSATDADLQYTVFSSNHVILSIYRFAGYEMEPDRILVSEQADKQFLSLLTIAVETPLCCSYKGVVKEMSFCFKPLGFNHFVGEELRHYFQKGCFPFLPFPDFETEMQSILQEDDEAVMQERVENYWLSKMKSKDLALLEKIVSRIQEDNTTGIQEIAKELGVSRQHIVRLFDAHLCKSPSVFRKIDRFRKTLHNRVAVLKKQDNLTALTYESFFYDQSHLIRDFKSLTGMSPGKFFEGNRAFENGWINWFFPA
jgi:AraC-like DNA-binding protein